MTIVPFLTLLIKKCMGVLFAGSDPLDTSFQWDSDQDRENWEQIPKILQWIINTYHSINVVR